MSSTMKTENQKYLNSLAEITEIAVSELDLTEDELEYIESETISVSTNLDDDFSEKITVSFDFVNNRDAPILVQLSEADVLSEIARAIEEYLHETKKIYLDFEYDYSNWASQDGDRVYVDGEIERIDLADWIDSNLSEEKAAELDQVLNRGDYRMTEWWRCLDYSDCEKFCNNYIDTTF